VKAEPGPFDVNYGLMTGEDADMLARLVKRGARIIWCDDAEVYEPVEPARLSLRWLLQRALSGGQEFARKAVKGIYGEMNPLQRLVFFGRCFAQLALAVVLAPLSLPIGKHHAANWLIKAAANAGKLSVLSGWRYREYA
jgi:succinoglycan biosynthesis protein ExoM